MRHRSSLSRIAVALLCAAVAASAAPQKRALELGSASSSERRVALVIGNGAYSAAPLKNPANDATDVAAALRAVGFEVTLGVDWSKRQMEEAIHLFGERLRGGGIGLFYFAGHGVQVRGRNYLIPVGASVASESDVEYEGVDAGRVLGKMEDAGNGFNIVILDACRNNPFARGFRSAEQGLAQVTAPTGSFIAYATAPGSVAADGTGRNGTFTAALLEAVRTPGLKVEDVFKRVRQRVARETANKQVPWDSSSLVGDFYFRSAAGSDTPAENPEPVQPVEADETSGPPTVSGRVTSRGPDGRDVPVAGANVDLYRTDLKAKFTVRTDSQGRFIFLGIPLQAVMTIVVSADGLDPQVVRDVRFPKAQGLAFTLVAGSGRRPTLAEIGAP